MSDDTRHTKVNISTSIVLAGQAESTPRRNDVSDEDRMRKTNENDTSYSEKTTTQVLSDSESIKISSMYGGEVCDSALELNAPTQSGCYVEETGYDTSRNAPNSSSERDRGMVHIQDAKKDTAIIKTVSIPRIQKNTRDKENWRRRLVSQN
ncbi:hypothetical protein AX774_g1164 [Zancudomyces culisetae]|uniref:Uncharacterized protein n=1 Tax=Zancudomyces culisetae TaxID=1213189 RepID=A0A1R1PWC7_ZANCU|nr:hypothetical protein AX774_g1164 [Zancudomyces culisetae]|eukprot:OMH85286.1 hypothetical protein AX774_g1164 [Zancudomyces culisetae]